MKRAKLHKLTTEQLTGYLELFASCDWVSWYQHFVVEPVPYKQRHATPAALFAEIKRRLTKKGK